MVRSLTGARGSGRIASVVAVVTGILAVLLVLSAIHLLPQLRNPFTQTTTDRSGPVLLKSITALSRYEAASGSFQVVVDLSQHAALMPSFLLGSRTLFVGQGTDIAFVDFSRLKGAAITVSPDRTAVTVQVPHAQLEPAVINVRQSYVFAQQRGLFNRIGDFFSGNPNSQQQLYILAQQKIQAAAAQSPLLSQADQNTKNMLTSLLRSLGFQQITVTFGAVRTAPPGPAPPSPAPHSPAPPSRA